MTSPSVFLCHSSKDKPAVKRIAQYLRAYGVKCWLDEAEIKAGESLTKKIGEAILSMQYFATFLSTRSVKSEWVQRELQIAIQEELSKHKVIVIPILLQHVQLPPFLRDKLYVDFTNRAKVEESIARLLNSIGVTKRDLKDQRFSKFIWHKLHHHITIKDIEGKYVIWRKITIVTPLRSDITEWCDEELHASGHLKVLRTNLGRISRIHEEGGAYSVITKFSRPLPIGKRLSKVLELAVFDSCTKKKESVSWMPIGDFEELSFHLHLPSNRLFKGVPTGYCYYGTFKRKLPGVTVNELNSSANWVIRNPQAGLKYVLEWNW